jgi:hypothetical protein
MIMTLIALLIVLALTTCAAVIAVALATEWRIG